MNFETDLDYQLLDQLAANPDEEALLRYIEENFVSPNITYSDGMSFRKCANIMKVLCQKMLKIKPSPEQWVFLLADCERLLCEACAGAGKTTMAQLRSVKEKLVHKVAGNNILALAYNNHAVSDMLSRHDSIIRKVNALGIPELRRDHNICCFTFHSFCKGWVEDYLEVFRIPNKNGYIMSETDRHEAMELAVAAFKKQTNSGVYVNDAIYEAMLALYSFVHETLRVDSPEEWKLCPSISDLADFDTTQLSDIFKRYDKWKSFKHKMDFTDLVDAMYTICCREDVMRRIRANYQIFILDEYQDFTPSMLRIIKIIMEGDPEYNIGPFMNAKLTCIGDGDQSIYGFRGTDPDNCVRFKDTFSSDNQMVRITAMSENRRCPEEIIACAKTVIESNSRRINKPIRATHSGGKVTVSKYYSCSEQIDSIVKKLKTIPPEEYSKTCICYRNQSSSYLLGLKLMNAGLPFRIVKGHLPLSDRLSQSLFDTLNMLSYPNITRYVEKALYKVLPKSQTFTRNAIYELLQAEEEARQTSGEIRTFFQLNYPESALRITGFTEAMDTLQKARTLHRNNKPLSTYVPSLIHLIRKYYLDWMMTKAGALSPEYIKYISEWFSRDMTYDAFMKQHQALLKDMEDNKDGKICVTTFHGLKGLEFDHVFIIDLNDTIFPGTELNQAKGLTTAQKDILECEARRLFYVALTRTRNTLDIYFDAEVPSRYIRFFTENTGLAKNYKDYMQSSDGYLISDLSAAEPVQQETAIDSFEELSSLEDLSALDDLAELPAVDLLPEADTTQQDLKAACGTSFFAKALAEDAEREERLTQAFGARNFESIKGKPAVMQILNRVLTESDKK